MNKQNINDLGALYHDYSVFGYENIQLRGIFKNNQLAKAPIITAYIQYAIAKSKLNINTTVSFAELFCADGYYAMLARHLGATHALGIDNGSSNFFDKSQLIAERIGITGVDFILKDVNDLESLNKVDIVANVGGLYHINNPREIIVKSYQLANKYLIIQTVVSLANDDEDYFEIPAPGWTWGNRMNKKSFHNMIVNLGYEIIDHHFNELEGNDRIEDRGSVYYLVKVKHEN